MQAMPIDLIGRWELVQIQTREPIENDDAGLALLCMNNWMTND